MYDGQAGQVTEYVSDAGIFERVNHFFGAITRVEGHNHKSGTLGRAHHDGVHDAVRRKDGDARAGGNLEGVSERIGQTAHVLEKLLAAADEGNRITNLHIISAERTIIQ